MKGKGYFIKIPLRKCDVFWRYKKCVHIRYCCVLLACARWSWCSCVGGVCMYVCTVLNFWWWTERTSEICRVFLSFHRAFCRLSNYTHTHTHTHAHHTHHTHTTHRQHTHTQHITNHINTPHTHTLQTHTPHRHTHRHYTPHTDTTHTHHKHWWQLACNERNTH